MYQLLISVDHFQTIHYLKILYLFSIKKLHIRILIKSFNDHNFCTCINNVYLMCTLSYLQFIKNPHYCICLFVLSYNLFQPQLGDVVVINGPNIQSSLNVCLFSLHHLFTNSFMTGTHFLLFKRKALEKSAVLLLACE